MDNALNILELLTSFKDKDTAVIITTHATHLIDEIQEGKFIKVSKGEISMEIRGEVI